MASMMERLGYLFTDMMNIASASIVIVVVGGKIP